MKTTTVGLAVLAGLLGACGGADGVTSATAAPEGEAAAGVAADIGEMYARFGPEVSVSRESDTVVLRTTDVPGHPSPYFGVGNPLYVAPQPGMVVNPNRILTQDFEFRVPAAPRVASASQTPLGAIGVAVNGVVLFNQYAAGFSPLDAEIRTFDAYNGHPQQSGVYHYHLEPLAVTAGDPTALVGVLLDGFPVYGTQERGGGMPQGLDECNGHQAATPDHPGGIYHYHVTAAFPYISGCFRGSPGRVTN